jgi:membrane-associated phospholipid phosphatase
VVTGLLISTVYLRYHYVIDVIAGIALTGLTIALTPGLQRLLAKAPEIRAMKKSAPGRQRDDKTSCLDDS